MLKFNIITVLPQLIQPHIMELPLKRALSKKLIEINIVNLRDFALDSYGTIDGKPYGGGAGMILRVEPIYNALRSIYPELDDGKLEDFKSDLANKYQHSKIILLDPKGTRFTQRDAEKLGSLEDITLISGRYEGVDERVGDFLATDRISIGDFVLSGGEIPALTVMEAVTRLIPGAIDNPDATKEESFSEALNESEYPQYTRPEEFKGQAVPKELLSGHHKNIQDWRKKQSGEKSY